MDVDALNQQPHTNIRTFKIISEIAKSNKGNVYKVRHVRDKAVYVLKQRRLSELGVGKSLMNEVSILQKIRHPNIVRVLNHFWEGGTLYMQLNYAAHGDLDREIQTRKSAKMPILFTAQQLQDIFVNVLNGLTYLHEHNIVHRDIKSSNIFIFSSSNDTDCRDIQGLISARSASDRYVLKIGDLGVSRECSEDTNQLETYCGTPLYTSPEICDNKPYSFKTDIWSTGVLFYETVTLTRPFQARGLIALASQICKGEYSPLPSNTPKSLRTLVGSMLVVNPALRPTAEDCTNSIIKRSMPVYSSQETPPEERFNDLKLSEHRVKLKKLNMLTKETLPRAKTQLRRKQLKLKNISAWGGAESEEARTLKSDINILVQHIEKFETGESMDLYTERCYHTCIEIKNKDTNSERPVEDKLFKSRVIERTKKSQSKKKTEVLVQPINAPSKHTTPKPTNNKPQEVEEQDYVSRMQERSRRYAQRLAAQRDKRQKKKVSF